MEEEILKIFDNEQSRDILWENDTDELKPIAKDVADLFRQFIEWLSSSTTYNADQNYEVMVETHILEEMNLEGAYHFWLTEVRNK